MIVQTSFPIDTGAPGLCRGHRATPLDTNTRHQEASMVPRGLSRSDDSLHFSGIFARFDRNLPGRPPWVLTVFHNV